MKYLLKIEATEEEMILLLQAIEKVDAKFIRPFNSPVQVEEILTEKLENKVNKILRKCAK